MSLETTMNVMDSLHIIVQTSINDLGEDEAEIRQKRALQGWETKTA